MTKTRIGVLLLAAAVLAFAGVSVAARQGRESASRSNLTGIARTMDSRPLDGVVVSARIAGRNITSSVVTDEHGEYVFPRLDSGRYDVWAQASGYGIARAEVMITDTAQAHQAFTLNTIADVTPQLIGSEWMAALPEETREQRRMKEIFRSNCTACHGVTHALQNRFDENGWRA